VNHSLAGAATGTRPPLRVVKRQPRARPFKVERHAKRIGRQTIAAVAAGFLPVASYVVARIEAPADPKLYGLVLASLAFSAPQLAQWAQTWCGHAIKAWGFAVLLEGVMILSGVPPLALTGLAILVLINATYAWDAAR